MFRKSPNKNEMPVSPNSILGAIPPAERKKFIDEMYNKKKLEDPNLNDQTTFFFDSIKPEEKKEFHSSTRTIIQLGISIGNYVAPLCQPSRPVIGYDHSSLAISTLESRGIIGREIDLNKIVNGNELSYGDFLRQDFSVPVDILMIRIIEALNTDAITLLMFSIIDLMKPGSRLYLEILSGEDATMKDKSGTMYYQNIQPGYIPSFFGPRTDIQFISRFVNKNESNDQGTGETEVERFIAMKR